MKLKTTWAFFIAIGLMLTACSREKTELKTVKEKASYAIGQQLSGTLVRVAPELDEESLIQGIKDTLAKKTPLIDNQAAAEALKEYNEVLQKAATDRVNAEAESNLKAANEFLEKNKLKEGVTVTESGLQYEMLQQGEGANPKETDVVKVHYRGTLLDGTEFDSSLSRGEPATFPLKQVISGWTEGIQLMKPGAKYVFYLPPALAYGPQGAGNTIGPNSLLIFEVELLDDNGTTATRLDNKTFNNPDALNYLGSASQQIRVRADRLRYLVRFRYPIDPLVDPSGGTTVDSATHYLLDTPVFDDISITYFTRVRFLSYRYMNE